MIYLTPNQLKCIHLTKIRHKTVQFKVITFEKIMSV